MTIDEASKELETLKELLKPDTDIHFLNAIGLGIEALKRAKGNRIDPQPTVYSPLPGETEE
jgi:hypothetical protein